MKKFVFSVASRATGRLQIKPSGSGDENGKRLDKNRMRMRSLLFDMTFLKCCKQQAAGDFG